MHKQLKTFNVYKIEDISEINRKPFLTASENINKRKASLNKSEIN